MDNMPGKNIGIAQPRSNPSWGATPHNRVAVTQGNFTFQRANSTMNSYFTSGSFGAPNSQNRKQRVYNQTPINSFALFSRRQKKQGVRSTSQQNVEAQVGQMDRLARLKAHAIKSSKPNPPAAPPAPVYPVEAGKVQNNNEIVDPLDDVSGFTGTGWVQTSGIGPGDTVSFINPVNNQLFTTTVFQLHSSALGNYKLILTDNHGQVAGVNVDINLHI